MKRDCEAVDLRRAASSHVSALASGVSARLLGGGRHDSHTQPGDMETANDLIAPFRLEIKDLGDRRREITYETDAREDERIPVTTLWTRKRYFTHKETVYKNVYLDESTAGQLRVVKEILHQDPTRGNRCLELEAAARIAKDIG